MYTLLLTISLLHTLVICDEVKVETPDTIYLPYSESEDVDFAIARPSKIGCYQWYGIYSYRCIIVALTRRTS